VPVCFSCEMRNSRGALTPRIRWGSRKPCPARLALLNDRQPCSSGSGQPYMLTILSEKRSMSNSRPWLGTRGPATLTLSVGRGRIGDAESGQRRKCQFVDTGAALCILNRECLGGAVARQSLVLAAQLGVEVSAGQLK
jgi:hypothetical protein